MRKHLQHGVPAVVSFYIFLILVLAAPSSAKTLEVRGDFNYPPYEFMQDGEPAGFNVDVMRAVAVAMGMDVEMSLGPWHVVRSQLEKGEIDALTGMYYSRERDMKVDFSFSHIVVYHSVFVREDSDIRGLDDLEGKEVVVQDLDIMHDFVEREVRAASVTEVETQADALRLLASGKHDAALLGALQGLYNIEEFGLSNVKPVGDPLQPREYCFAVPEGREMLLSKLNEGLAIIRKTGEYREIYDKWFGRFERREFRERLIRIIALVVAPLLAILALAGAWLWALRKTVKNRTHELENELRERKRAEDALRESEERYRSIFENIMDGYYRADLEGNLIMVNPQTVNMLGYDRDDELKGVNLTRDVYAYPEDRRPLVEQLRKKGYVKGFTATLVKKNGEHIDIEANSRLIRDKKGDPVAVEGVIRDVTERNRYARRLEEARLEAEAANMAKSEFLANMSHEIRTPLNGVLGMLQLLEGTRLDDEQKKYLHIALNSGRSLLGLISDILDLSKVEAGKIEVVNEPFRLDEVLESVTGSFRHQARLKNIDLKCKCPEDMHLTYFGDEKRLKQILFNLVGNAVKFTESGEVECEVTSLGKSESDEDRLLLIVRDSGEGIEEDDFQRIFEPFTQANGSYNRKYQGTGLGLTIVKRLVDLMGGAIDVESQVGGGTTVYLRLDLQPAEKPVEQVDEAEAEDLPRIKVLVVEDNLVNRMTVARMLQKLGLEALEAEDGEQALTVLEEETPDLVFMDVQMPNMDGIEATRAVRSGAVNGVPADLPIVALTAHAMAGDKEKFLDAGMDDYIAKPVDMGKLTEIVRRFSGRKSL